MSERAYRDGVPSSSLGSDGGGAIAGKRSTRRRRLPSAKEQARREAWGKQWGQIMKAAAGELGFGGKR